MTVAINFKAIEQWLEQTEGWHRVRATQGQGQSVAVEDILKLAEQCEWAKLEDMSELRYSRQGVMHPIGLELGWGEPMEAYQGSSTDKAGVYFFNAYR